MKFKNKRNEKEGKYFHAQKDRYLGIWLPKTSNSNLDKT